MSRPLGLERIKTVRGWMGSSECVSRQPVPASSRGHTAAAAAAAAAANTTAQCCWLLLLPDC